MICLLACGLVGGSVDVAKAEDAEYFFYANRYSEKEARQYSRAGTRFEDPYLKIVYDPVVFPGGQLGLYKRICSKGEFCSWIPVDHEGNVYLVLVRELMGEYVLRAPLAKLAGDEFFGSLHLESSMMETLRPCYRKKIDSREELPNLPKEAVGYVKIASGVLRKLAREQKGRLDCFPEEVLCKDANVALAILQEGIGDSEGVTEFFPKKPFEIVAKVELEDGGRIGKYLDFLDCYPKLFPRENGQILREREEILLAESCERERLIAEFGEGVSQNDYHSGVLYQDPRLTWVRFPLRFADGSLGLKNEIIQGHILQAQELSGSGIFAQDEEGKIVLLGIYRPPTGELEAELSKGAKDPGEDFITCAKREGEEELRRPVLSIRELGLSHTGLEYSTLETYPLFAAQVGYFDESIPLDPFEEITTYFTLSLSEIRVAYKRGYLEKEGIRYRFADPLLALSVLLIY